MLACRSFHPDGFCLWQPEAHLHGAVEVGGGGEFDASPLFLAEPESEPAETEMAVGHERTHAEFLGQNKGLLVMGFRQRALRGIAMRCDLTEETASVCLIAPFLVLTGEL